MKISYNGSTVTVIHVVQEGEDFDQKLSEAQSILGEYQRSGAGSTWGCDGVGYYTAKKTGNIIIHKSGVGPRKFKEAGGYRS